MFGVIGIICTWSLQNEISMTLWSSSTSQEQHLTGPKSKLSKTRKQKQLQTFDDFSIYRKKHVKSRPRKKYQNARWLEQMLEAAYIQGLIPRLTKSHCFKLSWERSS